MSLLAGFHTRTAVARLPLSQLGFLVHITYGRSLLTPCSDVVVMWCSVRRRSHEVGRVGDVTYPRDRPGFHRTVGGMSHGHSLSHAWIHVPRARLLRVLHRQGMGVYAVLCVSSLCQTTSAYLAIVLIRMAQRGTVGRALLSYGYNYKASCARPARLSRHL